MQRNMRPCTHLHVTLAPYRLPVRTKPVAQAARQFDMYVRAGLALG